MAGHQVNWKEQERTPGSESVDTATICPIIHPVTRAVRLESAQHAAPKRTCHWHMRPSTRVARVLRLLRCVEVWRRLDAYTRGGAVVFVRREMLRVYVKRAVWSLSSRPVRLCNAIHRLQLFRSLVWARVTRSRLAKGMPVLSSCKRAKSKAARSTAMVNAQ
eukprot:350708-Chlamydomonas_euryale.AAC.9